MTSVPNRPDRRAHKRYGVPNSLRYRRANSPLQTPWAHGCARDMSAGGILIHVRDAMPVGLKLEIAMDWTGLYHDRDMMRLYLIAVVTRVDRRGTALHILSHRFCEVRPMPVRRERSEKKLAVA